MAEKVISTCDPATWDRPVTICQSSLPYYEGDRKWYIVFWATVFLNNQFFTLSSATVRPKLAHQAKENLDLNLHTRQGAPHWIRESEIKPSYAMLLKCRVLHYYTNYKQISATLQLRSSIKLQNLILTTFYLRRCIWYCNILDICLEFSFEL